MNKLRIILIFMLFLSINIVKSQDHNPNWFECAFPEGDYSPASSSLIGGYYKPESIAD